MQKYFLEFNRKIFLNVIRNALHSQILPGSAIMKKSISSFFENEPFDREPEIKIPFTKGWLKINDETMREILWYLSDLTCLFTLSSPDDEPLWRNKYPDADAIKFKFCNSAKDFSNSAVSALIPNIPYNSDLLNGWPNMSK